MGKCAESLQSVTKPNHRSLDFKILDLISSNNFQANFNNNNNNNNYCFHLIKLSLLPHLKINPAYLPSYFYFDSSTSKCCFFLPQRLSSAPRTVLHGSKDRKPQELSQFSDRGSPISPTLFSNSSELRLVPAILCS